MDLRFACAVFCAVVFASCGGTPSRPNRYGPGLTETTTVEAPAASATFYASESTREGDVLGTTRVDAVRDAIMRAGTEANVTMEGDGRLAILAGWIGERLGPGGALPPVRVIQFFARHLGIPEPTWNQFLVGEADDARFLAAVQRATSHYVLDTHDNRFGAAIIERDGLVLAAVVLTARHLRIAPIRRTHDLSSTVRIQGELLDGFRDPSVVVTGPSGHTRQYPTQAGAGFDVAIQLEERGIYQLEVLGDAGQGHTVLANMPVYAGVPAEHSIAIREVSESEEPATEESVEEALLAQINETRASFGLSALVRDERVDAIAEAHTVDMRDHNFIAHVSPTTGTPMNRITAAGIHAAIGAENIGRAYTAVEIHDGLLDSPGHRANILMRDATHVGIGVVGVPENGRMAYLATEVFVQLALPIDVDEAPTTLLSEINRIRQARQLPSLEGDGDLSAIASRAAGAFIGNSSMSNSAAVSQATQELRALSARFSRGAAMLATVSSLADAAALEVFLETDMRVVGLGIAQGSRPDTGPNTIAVLILFGERR